MMNFFNKKDNGYIILKDGYNRPFIFGTILILCILFLIYVLSYNNTRVAIS